MDHESKVVFLTGFPSNVIARRLLKKLLAADRTSRVRCLTSNEHMDRANEWLAALNESDRQRVELLQGDVTAMDFGMTGANFLKLGKEIDTIHHCAAIDYPDFSRHLIERVNVKGTGEVLELADVSSHLRQFIYWSTALVSGSRQGVVMEDELVRASSFRNIVEETRFRAERIVRDATSRIPVTILRPSVVVGDAEQWEIDRFNGPYLLIKFLLNARFDMTIPLPKRGEIPLNILPVGYLVDAAIAIANDQRSIGRTFHIVDQNPPALREVCIEIANLIHRPLTISDLPSGLATALRQAPGIKQLSDMPRTYLEQLAVDVTYDTRNTRELLEGTALACPSVASYLEALVTYLSSQNSDLAENNKNGV
jgi:thioester reductase-like protein